MKLAPLYRLSFDLTRTWVSRQDSGEVTLHCVGTATGRCDGGIEGSFRGVNPLPESPGPADSYHLRGMIETEAGEKLLVDYQVTFRSRLEGGYQLVGTAQHSSPGESYSWLNGQVFVVAGEVRPAQGGPSQIVLEVDEMTWEPVGGL